MSKPSKKQRIRALEQEVKALRAIVDQLSNDVMREEPVHDEPHSWSKEPELAELDIDEAILNEMEKDGIDVSEQRAALDA